ncbi:MAG: hypothetical protein LBO09_07005 [Candidatus Peribacteria bacterium]|jgi:hypothetical protein|nr:hypothetical protein [Candidatus Peribacteria bacterium]
MLAEKLVLDLVVCEDISVPLRIVDNYHSLIGSILDKIGIKGIKAPTSYEEVEKTNKINKVLFDNQELKWKLKNFIHQTKLPAGGKDFLEFYFNPIENQRLKYFMDLENLIIDLGNSEESEYLKKNCNRILKALPAIRDNELKAANFLRESVEKGTEIQGRISLTFHNGFPSNVKDIIAYGFRTNFYGLGNAIKVKVPKWAQKRFWRGIGIGRIVEKHIVDTINFINQRNFYKDLILTETPEEIKNDIIQYIQMEIVSHPEIKILADGKSITFDVFYSYINKELEISLLDISSAGDFSNPRDFKRINFSTKNLVEDVLGEKVEENVDALIRSCFREKTANIVMKRIQAIPKIDAIIMAEKVSIPCEGTNRHYGFTSIEHLYKLPQVAETLELSKQFREEVSNFIYGIQRMAQTLYTFTDQAKVWDVKVSMPTVVPQGAISFKSLIPIHLIGRNDSKGKTLKMKDLRLIKDFPALQGQLLGLTGPNAGGKSVCHEAIMYNFYLAQAGLPVFGEGFTFSPKDFIGILSLEKGEGSTMELQVRKTKDMFDQIVGKNLKSLLVLDEIGTGTSPDQGYEYGKSVLTVVKRTGADCIYTTQLSAVAEYAETYLGAENYQLTKGYKIRPGIGKANIDDILKNEGMDKYFNIPTTSDSGPR